MFLSCLLLFNFYSIVHLISITNWVKILHNKHISMVMDKKKNIFRNIKLATKYTRMHVSVTKICIAHFNNNIVGDFVQSKT